MNIRFLNSIFVFLLFAGCGQTHLVDYSSSKIKYQFVNLKKDVDRKQKMEAQLNLAKVDYQVLEAVYGKELSKDYLDGLVKGGVFDANVRARSLLKPGEIGVYLSTLEKALPNAIANKDTITVTFEDDAIIPYDVDAQFRLALTAVPKDWDILYLGCNQNNRTSGSEQVVGPYLPVASGVGQKYIYPLCPTGEMYRIYGTPWIQLDKSCTAGAYAYAVRSSSAQKLLHMLKPMRIAVDMELASLAGSGKIKAYCLNPELIRADTIIPSTIR
jgi:GR25 family glycosyltransferase involved in LPS biosynthesis